MSATPAQVEAFLTGFKAAMKTHGLYLWETADNKKYMNDSGYTKSHMEDVINQLRARDYNKGPEPDQDASRHPGAVWVFHREDDGFPLYIKLKLCNDVSLPEPVICMSFHDQLRPMETPLKPVRTVRKTR